MDNRQQHSDLDLAALACNSSSFGVFQKTPREAFRAATDKRSQAWARESARITPASAVIAFILPQPSAGRIILGVLHRLSERSLNNNPGSADSFDSWTCSAPWHPSRDGRTLTCPSRPCCLITASASRIFCAL